MNNLIKDEASSKPVIKPHALRTLTGIEIDWDELLRLRPHTIINEGVPPYLLLPEVRKLIDQADSYEIAMYYETLFVTGARISELMKLTPASFYLDDDNDLKHPHVLVPTLKRRKKNKTDPIRLIHLEPEFVVRMRQFLGSTKRRHTDPLFPYSKRKLTQWFEKDRPKHQFDIVISPHTLRHSCAVHLVLLGFDLAFIQKYLGHASVTSTQVYTAVALPLLQKVRPMVRFR